MATNTALASLTALESLSGDVEQAEDAQTALDRITPDPGAQTVPAMDDEGNAKFGTAEAIATAVVATALLGPIGGVLIGGAQGILQRKQEQSVLDFLANENNAITDSMEVYEQQFSDLAAAATNPEDLQQLSAMRAKMDASFEMMTSGSAALKQAGLQGFAGAQNDLITYTDKQEVQRIAFDQHEAQLKRELGQEQYSRFTKLQDDFTNESAGYLTRQQAGVTALDALNNGSPSDLHAAMILFNKTLDPNSAVLGEERQAITEMGGALDKAYNFLNKAFDGTQMNATQRRNLGSTIQGIMKTSTQFQSALEGSYSTQLEDAELPAKFHDNFRLVDNTPAAAPLDIPPDLLETSLELDRTARENQSMAIGDTVDVIKNFLGLGKVEQDEFLRQEEVKRTRRRQGADPLTGIFPINRPTN